MSIKDEESAIKVLTIDLVVILKYWVLSMAIALLVILNRTIGNIKVLDMMAIAKLGNFTYCFPKIFFWDGTYLCNVEIKYTFSKSVSTQSIIRSQTEVDIKSGSISLRIPQFIAEKHDRPLGIFLRSPDRHHLLALDT